MEFADRGVNSLDGKILERHCWDPQNPNRISAELLRQHFHQAILANMRGAAGAPLWESDFPLGHDMMGEMELAPSGKELFEVELETRLAPLKFSREIDT